MFKRLASGVALVIILLGIIFIMLDILDIAEGYRLHWPIAVLNTACISAVALLTLYFATGYYLRSGSPEILALGCGILAFGFGIVLYSWLSGADLNTRITVYDSGVLLASAVYLSGSVFGIIKKDTCGWKSGWNKPVILYAAIICIITIIAWLAHQDVITAFTYRFTEHLSAREIVQGMAAICCVSTALIYLMKYRGSRADTYFWYSLGLVLFAAGVIFISRGHLESRIAWLGRLSQYVAGIYFLITALVAGKRLRDNGAASKSALKNN